MRDLCVRLGVLGLLVLGGCSASGARSASLSTTVASTHSSASSSAVGASSSGHSSSGASASSSRSSSASLASSSSTGSSSATATSSSSSSGTGSSATGSSGSSSGWPGLPATPAEPELWYLHRSYLSTGNASEPAYSEAIIDQAVDAGYTGMALDDDAITRLNDPGFDSTRLQEVVAYAVAKGLRVLPSTDPYGYSNDMVKEDGNLAEGMAVVGTQFTVVAAAGGNSLAPINSLPPVGNGDFESGSAGWLSVGDARGSLDTTASDCHGGTACGEIAGSASATDNARFTQVLTLQPWRIYHVQFWVRTSGLTGGSFVVQVLDNSGSASRTRLSSTLSAATGTTPWTQVDLAFNSRESTSVTLYLGIWGGNQGQLWIDDVVAEETALVNVLRRGGTPVRVYDASGTTYVEGTDYAAVVDPGLNPSPGNFDLWHSPPSVTVPAGSALSPGSTVSMDYYTIIPLDGDQVGVCLSEPAVLQWVQDNITALAQVFPAGTDIFLGYDEMRHVNSCQLCQSKHLSAGALLAGNVEQTWAVVSAAMPGAHAYVWDDMFDPHHDATPTYQDDYPVEGDLTGSWLGLQPGFIIMNWNLGSLPSSLSFFAGQEAGEPHSFQQIIAGYYDSGDGAGAASSELQSASGIPGVIGLMYTTWVPDYSQLGPFATAARAGWASYQASAP